MIIRTAGTNAYKEKPVRSLAYFFFSPGRLCFCFTTRPNTQNAFFVTRPLTSFTTSSHRRLLCYIASGRCASIKTRRRTGAYLSNAIVRQMRGLTPNLKFFPESVGLEYCPRTHGDYVLAYKFLPRFDANICGSFDLL